MSYTKHYRANHSPSGIGTPSMRVTADVDPQALTRLPDFVRSAIANMEEDDQCFASDIRGVMVISSLNGDNCMSPTKESVVRGATAAYVHLWADDGKYDVLFGDIDQSSALPARAAGVGLKTPSSETAWRGEVTDLRLPFDRYKKESGRPGNIAKTHQCNKISTVMVQEDGSHRMLSNRSWVRPLKDYDRGLFYASSIQQAQGASRYSKEDHEWWNVFAEDFVNTYSRSCEADDRGLGPRVGGTYVCISDFPVATMDLDDCKTVSLGEHTKEDLERFAQMHQESMHLITYLPASEKALLSVYLEERDDPKVTVSGSFSIFCYDAAIKTVMRPFYAVGFTTQAVYCPSYCGSSAAEIAEELEEFANGRAEWLRVPSLTVPSANHQYTEVCESDLLSKGLEERYWHMRRSLENHGWAGDAHSGNFGIAPRRDSDGELYWDIISIDFSDHCEADPDSHPCDSYYDRPYNDEEAVPFPGLLSV